YYKLSELATLLVESAETDSRTKALISRQIYDEIAPLQEQTLLLRPYVDRVLGETGWNHIADHRALNERVMRFTPISSVVYRQALLLARDGQQAAARLQLERAIWTFPGSFPAMQQQLEGLARLDRDPTRFPALLEFALQKYQEQQAVMMRGKK
ncbi:MAG: Wzy polymerase domain-containing protein, partial [Gallionellaceae bacterium]|nr:Wzy polymerase domain-containing protein [Gallionellaceae bacterium]